eukprot:TRINITY_DN3574_c0_g1_i1.p1 TRINITY_DN3574_c0_g1~~TRINITY_DN3574_c0_g1_i1.p1  ORF type:complete len:500 (-),score=106.99 TRINITY_DN3574_c0_g1_i1:15-1457(-)
MAASNVLQVGPHTYAVPVGMHAEQRQRLIKQFASAPANSYILLEGGNSKVTFKYDSDADNLFRQESYFNYLFGVREPDFYGAIEVATGKTTLFAPRLPEAYAVWMGKIQPASHFAERYGTEEARYTDELAAFFAERNVSLIYVLEGMNTDSERTTQAANFDGLDKFRVDRSTLHPVLSAQRVIKTEEELKLLRWLNDVSSKAHIEVMKTTRAGMAEFQLESVFLHNCYFHGGCRFMSYTCIVCAGSNGATLHYGHAGAPNDHVLKETDMCLFDLGAEYHCYCSDITVSFPVSGKFTADQRAIYEAVLDANLRVQRAMKPGVCWIDMHDLALRTLAEHLLRIGLVHGGSVDELMEADVPALFMPHGLGHFMGLDTHDVGGYGAGTLPRPTRPGFKSLRTTSVLAPNMVLTVEPGIYFIDAVLDKGLQDARQAKYLNNAVLQRFRGFGGVRIEDDCVVTATGCENMTKVPRTVDEIETLLCK